MTTLGAGKRLSQRPHFVRSLDMRLGLDRALLAAGVFIPGYLLATTLIAIVGVYSPLSVVLGGVVPSAIASWIVARRHVIAVFRIPDTVPTIVVVGVLLVMSVLNILFVGEHLLTDRDPGVYLNTARWLATHGDLLIEGATRPFGGLSGVSANWTGFYEGRADGLLYAQFLHAYPSAMAPLKWLFGDSAVRLVNVPLMAMAFAGVYLVITQFARHWFACIAVAASAMSVVGWYFARDAYTEPVVFLLLVLSVASLWIGYVSGRMAPVFVSALAVGATAAVRIDSWLFIGGFAIAVAVLFGSALVKSPASRVTVIQAMLVPYVVGLVGLVDGVLMSPGYIVSLMPQVRGVVGVSVVAFLLGLGYIAVMAWLKIYRPSLSSLRKATQSYFRWSVAAMVLIGALYLIFVRPLSPTMRTQRIPFMAEIIAREGSSLGAFRTMTELSLHWFSWYWGWIGVGLVVLGVLLVILRPTRHHTIQQVVLIMVGLMLVAYLVRPSIFGDQPWAMRRYLAPAMLMIPVVTAHAFDTGWNWICSLRPRRRIAGRTFLLGLLAIVVLFPLLVSLPILSVAHQRGIAGTTQKLCDSLPDRAAVIVSGSPLDKQFGATIRSFCDVPTVAAVSILSPNDMRGIALSVELEGFVPVFVSTGPVRPRGWRIIATDSIRYSIIDATVSRAPDSIAREDFGWTMISP